MRLSFERATFRQRDTIDRCACLAGTGFTNRFMLGHGASAFPLAIDRGIMKSDYSLLIVFSVSLSVSTLTQPCAHAQAQGSSDASSQSWTVTTQQQLPSNENPTRTSETHTESGG